ncbi:hypothetical protein JW926_11245, partial [Candidatus Sumerlaeota bacterium]|nr:hypothetical protein [Candidatus Sumerlaeota bacterium]
MYARIVIDGGGTKTSAIMVDENNSQLAIAQGGPANINKFGKNLEEGAERIWEIIKDLIDKLCQDSKKDASSIERICFGLAGMGIGESEQKKAFTRILDKEKLLSKS